MTREERMLARVQAHADELAASETRPGYILLQTLGRSPQDIERIAREFLATEGDVPEDVRHGLRMQIEGAEEILDRLRSEHFGKLGKPVPPFKHFRR